MKKQSKNMEWIITDFLNSEKALYLSAGIIGVFSVIIGILFFSFTAYKSFAVTLIVLGILESIIMFPLYLKQYHKIENKISIYTNNSVDFLEIEEKQTEKDLKSFFRLKLIYGFCILLIIVVMSFLDTKSIFFGISTALILHLSLAITIDNFGEVYTKKYQTQLQISSQN
ncbi:hypothetical protein [Aquimarina sp. SS2-1]|uniref:hypothetical protein n=1 Tax=Aquimarina besae TaxID=3342247 RepID=UPI00366B5485